MLQGDPVSLRDVPVRNISCPAQAWGSGVGCLPVSLPDDQGFHEEIQFVLFGTHLRQRLGTEGRVGRRRRL